MTNFIGNAIKFSDQGSVESRWKHNPSEATIEVEDTSPGISSEEKKTSLIAFAKVVINTSVVA